MAKEEKQNNKYNQMHELRKSIESILLDDWGFSVLTTSLVGPTLDASCLSEIKLKCLKTFGLYPQSLSFKACNNHELHEFCFSLYSIKLFFWFTFTNFIYILFCIFLFSETISNHQLNIINGTVWMVWSRVGQVPMSTMVAPLCMRWKEYKR